MRVAPFVERAGPRPAPALRQGAPAHRPPGPGRHVAWALLLASLLLVAPAAAYDEQDAPRVRVVERGVDDVARVWHEPEVVEPGTQWNGFIRFRPGHAIEDVQYQICDVGRVCFAPPTPATRVDNETWTFDTNDYRDAGTGKPVHYKAGWRLGTQFILTERLANGTLETYKFPEGIEAPQDLEHHYFAFDMPPADKDAPHPLWPLLIVPLAMAWRRRP